MLHRRGACSTVCLCRPAADRVEEMRFGRWLANPMVRLAAMERALNEQIGPSVAGLHVLAIQDTSGITHQAHAHRAQTRACLGLAGV